LETIYVSAARTTLRSAALTLLGLFAGGVFFIVIAPSLGRLPGAAYVRYWQALNTDYGRAMPPFLITCMGLIAAAAALSFRRGRATFGLNLAALGLLVMAVMVTTMELDGLNRLADSWDPDNLPLAWEQVRQRWLSWHLIRTVLAVLAFVSLLGAHTFDAARAQLNSN